MPVKLQLIAGEEGYLENTRLGSLLALRQTVTEQQTGNDADFTLEKPETGSYGKIRAHSSLMYFNFCSEAPRTDNGEQTEGEKNGEGVGESLEGEKRGRGGSLQGNRSAWWMIDERTGLLGAFAKQ